VNKINSITVSNTTSSAVACTIGVGNNATFGSATVVSYPAYQISVPANATLIVIDKTTPLYITENQSVGVTSGTANALTFTATFEAIS
jgi:regulation of enolase protein 1 (concanavalin A-like superfamily)